MIGIGGRDEVGPVAETTRSHLVDVEELGVDARHRRRVRLVVVVDQLDRTTEEPARLCSRRRARSAWRGARLAVARQAAVSAMPKPILIGLGPCAPTSPKAERARSATRVLSRSRSDHQRLLIPFR